jgi:hypothetical protein
VEFMNGLVQNYNPFENVLTRNESSLGRFDNFLGHPSDMVCPNFSENFKAHIEEANRSELFNTACVLFFVQESNDAKVKSEKREVSSLKFEEHGHHVIFYSVPEHLVELGWEAIRAWGFVLFHFHHF